jgi:RHS repeat-associated protein
MAVYEYTGSNLTTDTLWLREQHLYGNSRIGIWNRKINMDQPVPEGASINLLGRVEDGTFERGKKFFELSNHLGNVLATVSDKKIGIAGSSGNVEYFQAEVVSASDYYPFGMLMPGRQVGMGLNIPGGEVTGTTEVNGYEVPVDLVLSSRTGVEPNEYVASNTIEISGEFESGETDEFSAYIADETYAGTGNQYTGGGMYGTAGLYRYGFNGKENDNEVKGTGNQQDYGFRIQDPRLGRFLSVDPLTKGYPMLTPYQFASGNPIAGVDEDGLEFRYYSLMYTPGADGKSHLGIDKKIKVLDQVIRTTVIITGIAHPELIVGGSKFGNTPIWGISDEWQPDFETKMSTIRLSPIVVSPDGKTWRVLPENYDLDDLPSVNDEVWTTFDTPEEFLERKISQAENSAKNATNYAHAIQLVNGSLAKEKLPRFNGQKPRYQVNEKHVKLRKGQDATKLPDDAEDVYKSAVPDDPNNPRNWFGKNKDGVIYRYSSSNDGNAHFSGRSDKGDGIRNLSDYAKERLKKVK